VRRLGEPFAAVVFDLDGVLVDSEIWWDEVRVEFARRHGRHWTAVDRAAIMGSNSVGWSTLMRLRLGLEALDRQDIEDEVVGAMIERYRTAGAPRIDGAVETVVRIAADLPVAVASSAHMSVIRAALDSLGIADVFSAVVSSDEVALGKPAPDVYLLAAARLGIDPTTCLVVEDSLNGVLAGRAAGMTVVLVPNRAVPPAPGTREAASVVLRTIEKVAPAQLALLA
jgi:HAD superfamily hydrolase (TIGR01509 family)